MGKRRSPVFDLLPSAGFEQDHAAVVADIVYNDLGKRYAIFYAKEMAKTSGLAWRVAALGARLDLARVCLAAATKRLEQEGKKE